MGRMRLFFTCVLAFVLVSSPLRAQDDAERKPLAAPENEPAKPPSLPKDPAPLPPLSIPGAPRNASASLRPGPLFRNLAQDQKAIWTSSLSLRLRDVAWLAPLTGVAAGIVVSEAQFSRHLNNSPSRLSNSSTLSNLGVGGLIGIGGGIYLLGAARHDGQMREPGILSGEAAVDSYAVARAMKFAFGR